MPLAIIKNKIVKRPVEITLIFLSPCYYLINYQFYKDIVLLGSVQNAHFLIGFEQDRRLRNVQGVCEGTSNEVSTN